MTTITNTCPTCGHAMTCMACAGKKGGRKGHRTLAQQKATQKAIRARKAKAKARRQTQDGGSR